MNAYKTHTISTVVFDRLFAKNGIPSSVISDVEPDFQRQTVFRLPAWRFGVMIAKTVKGHHPGAAT
jgi:hypothetical protein